MKFKENAINPGMVIHCPKEEDARALMNHLKDIDYVCVDYMDTAYSVYGESACYKISRLLDGNLTTEYSPIKLYRDDYGYKITEFSDLIEPDEPQMNAVEMLEWFHNVDADTIYKVFGISRLDEALAYYEPNEIIQRIKQHEAAKKAPKPAEVKNGWRCEILKMGGFGVMEMVDQCEKYEIDSATAMDEAAERARQYAVENGVQTYFRVCGICRVKEDK